MRSAVIAMRERALLCLACACTLAPALARADTSAIALSYVAPNDCPNEDTVRAAIARAGGGPIQDGAALRATLTIERRDSTRLRARLELRGALQAERELEGERCAPLVDAAAWLIAQASRGQGEETGRDNATPRPQADDPTQNPSSSDQPETKTKPETQAPADEPEAQEVAAQPVPADARAEPSADQVIEEDEAAVRQDDEQARGDEAASQDAIARTPRTFELGAFVWADSGSLPKPALGVGFELALAPQRFPLRFAVRPRSSWPQSFAIAGASSPDARATLSFGELPLQLCGAFRMGALNGGPCLSAIAGFAHGRSRAIAQADSKLGLTFALEAALAGSMPAEGPFAVRAELALAASLIAPRFAIDEARTVHRTDAVVGRGVLGVVYRP